MLLLGSLASLRPEVVIVSANRGVSHPKDVRVPDDVMRAAANPSVPYTTAGAATDQNAYVQSGNSVDTPYSDIGVDGSSYVLGNTDTQQ